MNSYPEPQPSLRNRLSGAHLSASLVTGLMLLDAGKAYAQDTPPPPEPTGGQVQLGPVRVGAEDDGTSPANTLRKGTGLARRPGDVQGTPQTVTVIPQVIIQQQQATTIDQALRYVPGVTVATGEGGGGMNGDAFRIRGFDARGDIYVDGLRDFGAYVRDSFATETIQLLKGSSSQDFGYGSTGGVINQEHKKAHLGDTYDLQGTIGSGPQKRVVADVNQQLGEHTALRVVGMWHDQDIEDRDHVYSKRWGVLGSLGLGLGTDHSVTINYLHQEGNRRPDLGVPIPMVAGGAYPVTEYGVPRSNFYGKATDRDDSNVDMVTVQYKGKLADWLTVTNDTRYASYDRSLIFTGTVCGNGSIGGFINLGTCGSDVMAGNLNTAYTIWPVPGNTQKTSGGQNITTAVARFDTGGLKHELVVGVDAWFQRNRVSYYTGSGFLLPGTVQNPDFSVPPGYTLQDLGTSRTRARSWNIGVFASDHLWFTDTLSLLAGARWDSYHTKSAPFVATTGQYNAWAKDTTNFLSPKASLIWEPHSGQNYYVSYARSFTPQGANISFLGTVSTTQPNLEPDKNYTIEAGGKWSVLGDQLGLTAAAFRTIKNRGSYSDPVTGASIAVGEKDRVQGFELGATGKITPAWDIQASYSYLDSKILVGPALGAFTPFDVTGLPVAFVAKNNVGIWTTYDVATLIPGMPGRLLIGGGMNYRSGYSADAARQYLIPSATTVDGLVSWENDHYRIALNVTNLTDTLSYTSAFTARAEVAAGRTFAVTGGVRF